VDIQRSTYCVEAMARAMVGEPMLFGTVDCALRLYDPHTGQCLDLDELAAAIGGIPAAHQLWDPTMHIDECLGGSPPLYPEDGDIIIYRGVSPGCWTLEKITSYFPGGW